MVLDVRSGTGSGRPEVPGRGRVEPGEGPSWLEEGIVSVRDLNTHASAIVRDVAASCDRDEQLLVTRHGRVVAGIVPMTLREAMQQPARGNVRQLPSDTKCAAINDGIVSIRDLGTHASRIVHAVEQSDDQILITRHGKVVAAIVPMTLREALNRHTAAD